MATANLNEPARMSGVGGLSGPRYTVTAKEAKARRTAMLDLMSNGLTDDEIVEVMQTNFKAMTDDEILRLKTTMRAQMLADFEEQSPLFKATACRRLQRHIVQASSAKQYGAVANLEGQLSKIQGTESVSEAHITIDARLQQATLQVLGSMTPAQVQELVAEELKRLPRCITPNPSEAEK